MQKVFEELTTAFRKNDGVLHAEQYKQIVTKHTTSYGQCLVIQGFGGIVLALCLEHTGKITQNSSDF